MAGPARTVTPLPRRNATATPAKTLSDLGGHGRLGIERDMIIGKVLDGKINVCGTVALTNDGATTTTDIDDQRIGPNTVAFMESLDAGAATERGGATMYQSVNAPGKIRITHSASATTRTFAYALLG
jgi:hypothetical protein